MVAQIIENLCKNRQKREKDRLLDRYKHTHALTFAHTHTDAYKCAHCVCVCVFYSFLFIRLYASYNP